ncbi:sensor histidine kinase [Brevibacterium album]|uniref:sensor histidine kinase n=1 Tax=Brevibacterium album TaxID=417948 RepID=UPI0006850F79|nr:histidine kinase [Brevibacterium album]
MPTSAAQSAGTIGSTGPAPSAGPAPAPSTHAQATSAWSRVHAFFVRRPWISDGLFWALPLMVLTLMSTSGQVFVNLEAQVPIWVTAVIGLLMSAPLALRRSAPLLSSSIIAAGCLLSVVTTVGPTFAVVSVPLTIFSTTKWGTRTHGRIVLAMGMAGSLIIGLWLYLVVLSATVGPDATPLDPLDYVFVAVYAGFCAAIVLSAWLLGGVAHRRRREIEGIRERNRLLEQERAAEARLAADAERMRIAREMHDVIAHSLSAVIVQADGGRYAARTDPAAAAEVLATIAETGRSALAQTRSLLGVLRGADGEVQDTAPLPGLRDIPGLIDDLGSAGLRVRLRGAELCGTDRGGRALGLSEPVQLAVYRIAQESLTNVLKHAGAHADAEVALALADGALVLTVSNRGMQGMPARTPHPRDEALAQTGGGNGIIGMRERAQLHGGELEAGPLRDAEGTATGFRVTARFPVPEGHTPMAAPAGAQAPAGAHSRPAVQSPAAPQGDNGRGAPDEERRART